MIANEVDGATGEYLLPPMKDAEVAEIATYEPLEKNEVNLLRAIAGVASNPHFGALSTWILRSLRKRGGRLYFGSTTTRRKRHLKAALTDGQK